MKSKALIFSIICLIVSICACSDKPDQPVEYDHNFADYYADWSPDGTKLVFSRVDYAPRNLVGGLYFYNFGDSSLTLLMEHDIFNSPRFSPDGEWLTFSSGKEIYIIKNNGDSLQQLTSSYNNYEPDWSPDGTKIVYDHRIGDDRGVHIYNLVTGVDKLTHPYSSNPVWMPDGISIALFAWIDAEMHLIIIDTLGNTIKEFNDPNSYKRTMDVSPDGRFICFDQQYPSYKRFLNILDVETGVITPLFSFAASYPAFSPEGKFLAYTRAEADDGSLWIMNLETKERRQITLLNE